MARTKANPSTIPREGKEFLCETCGCYFARPANLRRHQFIHDDSTKQLFPCSHPGCGKSFRQKANLRSHMLSCHEKPNNLRCMHCTYVTSVQSCMNHHLKKHIGLEREYIKVDGSKLKVMCCKTLKDATLKVGPLEACTPFDNDDGSMDRSSASVALFSPSPNTPAGRESPDYRPRPPSSSPPPLPPCPHPEEQRALTPEDLAHEHLMSRFAICGPIDMPKLEPQLD
ncbi:hypothetical protein CYLTODRAFT_440106 [Cylindrobasidium torrendii FP15055 ss-10]|uniref:C2H2-type domain-containing protein n=1 Tax=Cylindrobasidium torrendii FP15055 ss-10 TaxID=1314674 RepID=A0A0D7BRY5_9AGAR|nr:hypothetical protein CYLTODRAFT_440106 [Cylindrobasidium torrendii FP15055 ss-10]